jgi:hypothetical protein
MVKDTARIDRLASKLPSPSIVPKPNPLLWAAQRMFVLGGIGALAVVPLATYTYYSNLKSMSSYPRKLSYSS